VYRLRDLTTRQATYAALMVVLLAVPVVDSVGRAVEMGWIPAGDDALIGLRALDVGTDDATLVGQPSTSHLYGPDEGTSHPGPIEFVWLAAPMRVLGATTGMLVAIAAMNLATVLIAVWVVLRRAGPAVAAWSAVLAGAALWAGGSALLSDPISSSAGAIGLFALAALGWAIADGDVRLLPLGAGVTAWVAQQHLSIVMPAAALVAYALSGLSLHALGRRRARRRSGDSDEDPNPAPPWWPWVLGAAGLSALLWSPVVIDQVTGDPGNLTALVRYTGSTETETIGFISGVRQAARALGVPPVLVREDLVGRDFFAGPLRPVEVVVALALLGALVAIALAAWRRRRSLSTLAGAALVLGAAGVWNGSQIPRSVEAFRISFYRWTYVVAWLGWIAVGWATGLALRRLLAQRDVEVPQRVGRLAPVAAAVALLVPTVLGVTTTGDNDQRRDQDGFSALATIGDVAAAEADGAAGVTLVLRGRSAVLSSGAALGLRLAAAGHDISVAEQDSRFWGEHRILQDDQPGSVILLLATGRGSVPPGPGRVVASVDLNEDLRDDLAPLVAAAEGAEVVPSDRADEILARTFEPPQHATIRAFMDTIDTAPEWILTDERLVSMVRAGYYDSPSFDSQHLEALAAQLPAATVNDDDVFELRVLDAAELAALVADGEEP
jgi:hypothetical protein